jgi:hypothetical protein
MVRHHIEARGEQKEEPVETSQTGELNTQNKINNTKRKRLSKSTSASNE